MNENYIDYCIDIMNTISEEFSITQFCNYSNVNICYFDKNESVIKQCTNLVIEYFVLISSYSIIVAIISTIFVKLYEKSCDLSNSSKHLTHKDRLTDILLSMLVKIPGDLLSIIFSNQIYTYKGLKVYYVLFIALTLLTVIIDLLYVAYLPSNDKRHLLFEFFIAMLYGSYNKYSRFEYTPIEGKNLVKFITLIISIMHSTFVLYYVVKPLLKYFDIDPITFFKKK